MTPIAREEAANVLQARPNFRLIVLGVIGFLSQWAISPSFEEMTFLGWIFFIGTWLYVLNFSEKDRKRKSKADKELEAAGYDIAQAHFASRQEIERSSLAGKTGVFFGQVLKPVPGVFGRKTPRDVIYEGPSSVCVFMPPGGGKSTAIAANTLLSNVGHTTVVNDPKGELYAICGTYLRERGHRVITLAPWAKEISTAIGMNVEDHGLHLYANACRADAANILDEIKLVSSFLGSSDAEGSEDRFFADAGRSLVDLMGYAIMAEGRIPTLAEIRKRVNADDLQELLVTLSENKTAFAGVVGDLALEQLSILTMAPRQFAGGKGYADRMLKLYDGLSPIGQHFRADGFDPSTLKDASQPTTVFVIYPGHRLHTHAPSLNTTISFIIECVARHPNYGKHVRFLIDEAAHIGRIPNLTKAMQAYRGMGVQVVLFWQAVNQLSLYGQEKETILAAAGVKAFSNIHDHLTAKMCSEFAGEHCVKSVSITAKPKRALFGKPDTTTNTGLQTRPLFRPNEIREMSRESLLIIAENTPPVLCKKVPYYTRPEWSRATNPYFSH